MSTEERKTDHLDICSNKPVQFRNKTTGFEAVELVHNAVPDIDLDSVNTRTRLFNRDLEVPLIISAMTGGTRKGEEINKKLASACQKYGLGFGVGSQRVAIEKPETARTFQVRDVAPDVLLLGNLGLIQFCKGYGVEQAREAINMINADALCIHLNAAQELAQPGGDTQFGGAWDKLSELTESGIPIIAKEVGAGISRGVARRLVDSGVSGIDVGGAGGTSWVGVEWYRHKSSVGSTFWDWGIPTAASICYASNLGVPVIATGGVRTGLDAAKAIALGADAVGIALPALLSYPDRIDEYLRGFIEEFKAAMFLTGSSNINGLKSAEKLIFEPLRTWVSHAETTC